MPAVVYSARDSAWMSTGHPPFPYVPPGPDPDPEDPIPAPASWQDAVDSRDIRNVVRWYETYTGFDGINPEDPNDLPLQESELVNMGGTYNTTHDGQVITGIKAGALRIRHNNVTVRRSLFDVVSATYGAYFNPTFGSTIHGLLVEFCTFKSSTLNDTNAFMLRGAELGPGLRRATVRYCDQGDGLIAGLRLEHAGLIEYNYFHDFVHPPGGHSNGIRCMGLGQAIARRNYTNDGSSGCHSIYFDKEPTGNIRYEENITSGTVVMEDGRIISGESSPSYAMLMKSGDYGPAAQNIEIVNNYVADGMQYGYFTGGNVPWGQNGNVREGNVIFETGAPAPFNI